MWYLKLPYLNIIACVALRNFTSVGSAPFLHLLGSVAAWVGDFSLGLARQLSVQQPKRKVLSCSAMCRKAGTVVSTGFAVQERGRNDVPLQ